MIISNCIQLSDEWYMEKAGVPSASNFDKIVTTKGEPSKQREKYLYQLAGENIVGIKTETYSNAVMERGVILEAEARNLFKMVHDVDVTQIGLCYPDEQKKYACSPDGLLENAGLEIKCPLIHTHVDYLIKGVLPTDYIQQVQGSMLITGFSSWWFMSYYPGLPPLILEVKRDNEFISKLETELEKFVIDLATMTKKLKELL